MISIVPLAGPDFVLPDGTLRPFYPVDGVPLLLRALKSRSWHRDTRYIFVVRKTSQTDLFVTWLKSQFKDCLIVELESLTKGALLSCLAGAACVQNENEPIAIDLADILYRWEGDPHVELRHQDGMMLWFPSENPKFSYLVKNEHGHVMQTAEKKVISPYASAGTYFFKHVGLFLEAAAGSITKNETTNGSYFVCPAFNTLIEKGCRIGATKVEDVVPISEYFHKKLKEI